MFDLEGLPPQLDELEKIYLWGMQVFGERPGEFRAATAGFGRDGDREGWFAFLAEAAQLFAEHGDIPFVHWASYELTKLNLYLDRYLIDVVEMDLDCALADEEFLADLHIA